MSMLRNSTNCRLCEMHEKENKEGYVCGECGTHYKTVKIIPKSKAEIEHDKRK